MRCNTTRAYRLATVASIALVACSAAKPVTAPIAVPSGLETEISAGSLRIRAAILNSHHSAELFHVSVSERNVLPIAVALTNAGDDSIAIPRESFRLHAEGGIRVVPALPGRAASLLRDTSDSEAAAIAGWLVLGVLASPAIHESEKREEAAVLASRGAMFAGAELAPGQSEVGYLIFELPVALRGLRGVSLEFRVDSQQHSLPMVNPYAREVQR